MAPKPKKKLTKEEKEALAAIKLAKVNKAKEEKVKKAEKKAEQISKINRRSVVSGDSEKVPGAAEEATDTAEEATDTTGLSNKPEHVKARAEYKKTRAKWEVDVKKKESKVKKKRLERAYGTREQNKVMGERGNKNPFTEGYNLAEGRGKFKPEFESQFQKSASKKAKTLEKLDQVDAAKTEIKTTLPQSLKPDKTRHGKRKARYGARLQARATTKAGVGRSIPEHIRGWRESLKKKNKK